MTALADLDERIADLRDWLPRAQALTTQPDTTTRARTQPASRPPWNSQVAHALYDALEGIRQLEAELRCDVTGRRAPRRPMSRTGSTLAAILRLSEAVGEGQQRYAGVLVIRWTTPILQLAAVDEEERPVDPRVPCPRCCRKVLLWWPRGKKLACKREGLKADLVEGELSAAEMVVWEDGFVQVAPVLDLEEGLVT